MPLRPISVLPAGAVPGPAALALTVVMATFVSEDAAVLAAAGLAATRTLPLTLAFGSSFAGIWIGDLGLYALGRQFGSRVLHHPWLQRLVSSSAIEKAREWFRSRGARVLVLSRVIPGTRLPAYVAAGSLGISATFFSLVTLVCSLAWTAALFLLVWSFPSSLAQEHGKRIAMGVAALILLRLAGARLVVAGRALVHRLKNWEFWPAWLFYIPVAFMCGYLALRYRGLALPAIANPGQRNGGVVGESKIEILRELMQVAPEFTAESYAIDPGESEERVRQIEELLKKQKLQLPFVLKPDVAQRGDGFKRIATLQEAGEYIAAVRVRIIAQRYAPGPREAGIFYYRLPGEPRGNLFAITEKIFPAVEGDDVSTFEQLVRQDARASRLEHVYLARFPVLRGRVLRAGLHVQLVQAGNHCKGAVFQDGMHLYSEQLRESIDRISQRLTGFFIGRYDVRYANDDDLRAGMNFIIVELNGSASEATSIYDARNTLWQAYRTLFRQWELVYRIGAENRRRGCRPQSASAILSDWFRYRTDASTFPLAD